MHRSEGESCLIPILGDLKKQSESTSPAARRLHSQNVFHSCVGAHVAA